MKYLRKKLVQFKQWILHIIRQRFNIIPCHICGSLRTKVLYESQHPYCKEGIMMKHYECKKCGNMDGI